MIPAESQLQRLSRPGSQAKSKVTRVDETRLGSIFRVGFRRPSICLDARHRVCACWLLAGFAFPHLHSSYRQHNFVMAETARQSPTMPIVRQRSRTHLSDSEDASPTLRLVLIDKKFPLRSRPPFCLIASGDDNNKGSPRRIAPLFRISFQDRVG